MSSSDPFGDFGSLPEEPPRRFEVRDPIGRLVAIQFRRPDLSTGRKLPWWTSPGDPRGLGGFNIRCVVLLRTRLAGGQQILSEPQNSMGAGPLEFKNFGLANPK